MRPDFGANLGSLAFAANTPATANLARHLVETALARWEPRIEVLDVAVANDLTEAALTIIVTYRVAGSSDVRDLVQPVSLDVAP
jgi:phage baseplate assembly protein W